MAMSRVEAAAYVVDHSISTSLTDPVRPLAASGAGRRVRPTDPPTDQRPAEHWPTLTAGSGRPVAGSFADTR